MSREIVKVWISYSHDSQEHIERVRRLSDRLRTEGIDCHIDLYEPAPSSGWPVWMEQQIEWADFVLVVCTETYFRRTRGEEEPRIGRGSTYEFSLLLDLLYQAKKRNRRTIPVLFEGSTEEHIPLPLRSYTRYYLDEQYDDLYYFLRGLPRYEPATLGRPREVIPNPPAWSQAKPTATSQSANVTTQTGKRDLLGSIKDRSSKWRLPPLKSPRFQWLASLIILLPLSFILGRYLGLSRQAMTLVLSGLFALSMIIPVIGSIPQIIRIIRTRNFGEDLGHHFRTLLHQRGIRKAVNQLSKQWSSALLELKEARIPIYELPWFLLIGEPQSGKTTTLRESGIQFWPNSDNSSEDDGTRYFDWWLTEEAVILDIVGRFSFHEEVEAPDRYEWEHFLSLLRKHRKEYPINGVLVAIPATSLIEDTLEEQRDKAYKIRGKLLELQKKLDIYFPVFILITKADRILGFADLFAHLGHQGKRQILGWTNPEITKRWRTESFKEVFNDLINRMHKIRLTLLRDIHDLDHTDRMFVLPEEFASLEEPLRLHLDTIFCSVTFDESFIFRGFYLTSGLQEGRPIAHACRDLLQVQAEDSQGVLEDLESVFSRQYAFFIRDLYEKKVFPEQGLVRQTFEAQVKSKRNRKIFYGLLGTAVVAAFLLLVPALLHMAQVLRPVSTLTKEAKVCIEASATEAPCSVLYTWVLIHDLELVRSDLRSSRWKIRILLQGGINNEISNELLPTVQAGLMRSGILGPLLDSFEARSTPDIWQGETPFDYETYRAALENRLRFDQYQRVTGRENRDGLNDELTLEPLLRFLAAHPGEDPTIDGEEIDEWLGDASQYGDIEEIETIFQSVLHADERFDLMRVGQLEAPERARRTFEAYWSMPVLARWDYELIDSYLEVYQTSYEDILALDPVTLSGEETLARFTNLGTRLNTTLQNGRDHLATKPGSRTVGLTEEDPELGSEDEDTALEDGDSEEEEGQRRRRRRRPPLQIRPGLGVDTWQKNCLADYNNLRQIYDRLVSGDAISKHCRRDIPDAWQELVDARDQYNHLYEPADDGGFAWSPNAETLALAVGQLAELTGSESIADERDDFELALGRHTGDQGRIEELRKFYERRKYEIWTTVDRLKEFERQRPDERFRAIEGRARGELVAALVAGLEILPPAKDFLLETFRTDCRNCFSKSYAESYVRPANEFLGWAHRELAPANTVQEVRSPLQSINSALYNYLEAFLDSSSREELSRSLLEEFSRSNERLKPLLDKLKT